MLLQAQCDCDAPKDISYKISKQCIIHALGNMQQYVLIVINLTQPTIDTLIQIKLIFGNTETGYRGQSQSCRYLLAVPMQYISCVSVVRRCDLIRFTVALLLLCIRMNDAANAQ